MKNEESLASLDNIVYLRDKSNQEAVNLNFRSKLIGGLNEEDVKKYISFMEDKYQQLEQEMTELKSTKNLLQAELAICKATTLEEKKSLLESLEKAQNDLAAYVDECNYKDQALKSMSDKKDTEIAQLQDEIRQMAEKQTELKRLSSVPSQETEKMAKKAAGLEQENNVLKSKIAELEKEKASLNNNRDAESNKIVRELEQQLEFEKSRNEKQSLDIEKAQNDLAARVDEIAQLQEEIRQMAEKQTELEKLSLNNNRDAESNKIVRELEQQLEFEKARNEKQSLNIEKVQKDLAARVDEIAQLQEEIRQMAEKQTELEKLSLNNNRDAESNKIVRELEQQLEFEKSRNEKQSLDIEKAQNDLAACVDECNNKDQALKLMSDEKDTEIAQLQEEIRQMAEKQTELEKLSLNNNRDAESNNIVRELEQQIEFEKSRNENQSKDLEMYNQKVITLEDIIARNLKEIETQRKLSEKTEQELKLEKARVSNYKVLGFKDEIVNIYQQLEHLTAEQVNINSELRHQLEAEQLRADKAENSLAELTKWVSELKGKLFNGQNMFETQVRQFAEFHNQFKTEISGCFQNIEELR